MRAIARWQEQEGPATAWPALQPPAQVWKGWLRPANLSRQAGDGRQTGAQVQETNRWPEGRPGWPCPLAGNCSAVQGREGEGREASRESRQEGRCARGAGRGWRWVGRETTEEARWYVGEAGSWEGECEVDEQAGGGKRDTGKGAGDGRKDNQVWGRVETFKLGTRCTHEREEWVEE